MTRIWTQMLTRAAPLIILLAVLIAIACSLLLAPHSLTTPIGASWSTAPGALLGTDSLGRDVWSRVLAGGAGLVGVSIPIGVGTTLLGAILGLMATQRDRLDHILNTITATTLALPSMLVVLCAAVLLPAPAAVALCMAALGVPLSARIIRASAGPVLGAEFLRAARRRRESTGYIVVGELIPALSGTIIGDAAIRILASFQLLAALHILGFGPSPPAADWAIMVRENLPGISLAPWSVVAPAFALALVSIVVLLSMDAFSRHLAPSAGAKGGRASLSVARRHSTDALLRAKDLRLGNPEEPLVQVEGLSLHPGEILGIRGPSGSGKTSLLETLLGAPRLGLSVQAAELVLLGDPMPRRASDRARLRRRFIGWSEQDPRRTIDEQLTVAEVIGDGRKRCHPVADLLTRLDLPPEFGDRRASALSGGQATRISLARALAGSPKVLALDEPTAGLDRETIAVVSRAIVSFARAGGAVVVISHDTEWLDMTGTRILRLGSETSHGQTVRSRRQPRDARRHSELVSEECGRWHDVAVEVEGRITMRLGDLIMRSGEMVALLAPSGAGKSSLLQVLCGDRSPPAVHVRGAGLPLTRKADPRITQLMVQDSASALNPGRSVLAQVARQARVVTGSSRRESLKSARETLAEVGLTGAVMLRRPGECSGGERQRAALARALVVKPKCLLLDEPTSAQDPVSQQRVIGILRRRAEAGAAILIATHDEEVASASDRSLRANRMAVQPSDQPAAESASM